MRRISTYTNGNSLWLLFNIVGTVMIYFWGLPQKQFTNGILSIGILGSDEEVAEADKAKQRHTPKSLDELSFIVVGVVLQLISAIAQSRYLQATWLPE